MAEVITKLQTKPARDLVSLNLGTQPYSRGQEVVRAEWGSNPISWNRCTSLDIQRAKQSSWKPAIKYPLAQHGRRGKRLKLNTATLRGAAQAHTDSRGTRPTKQAGAAVLLDRFRWKGCCRTGPRTDRRSSRMTLFSYSDTPISVWWSFKNQALKVQRWWRGARWLLWSFSTI